MWVVSDRWRGQSYVFPKLMLSQALSVRCGAVKMEGRTEKSWAYLLWQSKRNTSDWLTSHKFNKLIEFIPFNPTSEVPRNFTMWRWPIFCIDSKTKRCLYTKHKCLGRVAMVLCKFHSVWLHGNFRTCAPELSQQDTMSRNPSSIDVRTLEQHQGLGFHC